MAHTLVHRLEKYGSTVPLPLGVFSVVLLVVSSSVPIAMLLLYLFNGDIVDNAALIITITSVTVSIPILVFIFLIFRSLEASRSHLAETRNELNSRVEELAAARADAEEANKAKSVFLANMSHELRTPLNAVMGFSEMLVRREVVNPNMTMVDVEEYGDMIHQSGGLLLSLVNDLLDIAKIEAGKLELLPELVRVGDALDDVNQRITMMASKRGTTLEFDQYLDDIELFVDRRALDQMLLNLLSNAVKFSPRQSQIAVRLTHDINGLAISVSNPGAGMNSAEIGQAVQPFTQLSTALIASDKGSGLGLAIVISLIELEGGELSIISTPNEETTVTIRYPAKSVILSEHRMVARA